jgi:hypothetical protein
MRAANIESAKPISAELRRSPICHKLP